MLCPICKGATKTVSKEMVLNGFNGCEFEQTPGDSEGQTEPGRLQSRESLRVAHDLATEQQHVDISTLRIWCPVSA